MEEIFKVLEAYTGRVIRERQGQHYLALISLRDKRVVVCTRKGTYAYYAKILLEDDLPSLNCNEAFYTPKGLFVFGSNIEEFVKNIVSKSSSLVESSLTSSDP